MSEATCLRIYLSESDHIDGVPAAEAVLELCQQAGLRGVSVMRGIEGMGKHGIHTASFLALSSSLPLIIDIIAPNQDIQHAMQIIQPHIPQATIVTWEVKLVQEGVNT